MSILKLELIELSGANLTRQEVVLHIQLFVLFFERDELLLPLPNLAIDLTAFVV